MQCHDVWNASLSEQCAFVKEHCPESSGIFDFLRLNFCSMQAFQTPFTAFIVSFKSCRMLRFLIPPSIQITLVLFLFLWFGTTAGDFFCPNVSSISKLLGLTETVAGVTLAALGNGAPDMFATFSAMRSGSGMLALGELLGAALFITLIVVGAVALTASTTLPRVLFVTKDGKLTLLESISMVLMYLGYVSVVVIGHVIHQKSKRRVLELEAATQALVYESGDDVPSQLGATMLMGDEETFYDDDEATTSSAFVPHIASEHFPFLRGLSDLTGGRGEYSLLDSSAEETTRGSISSKLPFSEVTRFLTPTYYSWSQMSIPHRILGVITFPIIFMLRLSIPVIYSEEVEACLKQATDSFRGQEPISLLNAEESDTEDLDGESGNGKSSDWISVLQLFCGPQLIAFIQIRWAGAGEMAGLWLGSLLIGGILGFVYMRFVRQVKMRKLVMLSTTGFIVSIFWIYAIASELVGLLEAVGVIFKIKDAVMGLTIFALGNSLGDFRLDLVTNMSIARMGSPAMALGACFGSPMMNILLGVGVTATSIILPSGNPYILGQSAILQNTCLALLISLAITLLLVIVAKFKIDFKVGWVLLVEYAIIAYIILQTKA
ncbi:hypothetical protein HDU67_004512 [Dinochytrium kinnereticum]|nr:hypothetical protein HDU67_004512 [Dinochytrium kinnereticum]